MHLKVWRIAGIVSGLVLVTVGSLFAYQVFVVGNPATIAGLREVHPNLAVAMLLVLMLYAAFIGGLITFPFYWIRSAGLMLVMLGMRSMRGLSVLKDLAGLAASCGCIVLAIWLAFDVVQLK